MEAQDPSVPPGTIVQVFQNGYVIEDRVLRPAMVVVAKASNKRPHCNAITTRASVVNISDAMDAAF